VKPVVTIESSHVVLSQHVLVILVLLCFSGKEMRQSEDRRKKAAYREELKRQMQEMIANKQRSAYVYVLIGSSIGTRNIYSLLSWVYVIIVIIVTYFCEIL